MVRAVQRGGHLGGVSKLWRRRGCGMGRAGMFLEAVEFDCRNGCGVGTPSATPTSRRDYGAGQLSPRSWSRAYTGGLVGVTEGSLWITAQFDARPDWS